jgi:molybdopterin synthase catalytic subunit
LKLPSSRPSAAAESATLAVEAPTRVQVVDTLPDLEDLIAGITLKTTGAVCVFTGLVRGETHRDTPHETVRLVYEAYVPMAEAKLAQVAAEIRARWPEIQGLAIVHRVGVMEVGVPIVYVACTSAHRGTALFEAARYGIDRLKEIVPIWKKEIGPQGEVWVEGDYQPQAGE